MGYSKHSIELTDIECLVVMDSLSMLIANEYKHEKDKEKAKVIYEKFRQQIKVDKSNDRK